MSSPPVIRLRIRTALFIAGAFSILLTTYFAASYISIKHTLIAKSDGEVYEQIDAILSNLRTSSDAKDFQRIASAHNSTGEALLALKLVRFENPTIVYQSLGPARLKILLDSLTFIPKELPINIQSEKNTIRIFAGSNRVFTIFAAINTVAFQEVFDAMLQTYFLLLITGILVSFLIAMFTAGLALKPLKILVDSARTIKDDGTAAELPTNTRILEINELALVINEILLERDRNIAALRDFTADAAHELRTPLTILKGEFEVDLRTKIISEQERESVKSNLEEVERLIRIVEDLLTLARAEQTEVSIAEENEGSFQIDELLSEIIDRLSPLAEERSIHINYTVNHGMEFDLSKEDVAHILFNIILNAIQYSPMEKQVSISEEKNLPGDYILSIKDEGIGIDSKQIQHVFERFWRADASHSRYHHGTGLGLTIAKTFADRNGIELRCESSLGKGTTMRVVFPASKVIP